MQAVVFIGLQGSGKSTFYKERFFATHVRISMDLLRTRRRERGLMDACLSLGQRIVVDNTNLSVAERSIYLAAAKAAKFRTSGYYFQSKLEDCLRRNEQRAKSERIPKRGLLAAAGKLIQPSLAEGFDELFHVRISEGVFVVEKWIDEV